MPAAKQQRRLIPKFSVPVSLMNLNDPICNAIGHRFEVKDFFSVFYAFLHCQSQGWGLFFSSKSEGLKSHYADDSELAIQFGDFTRLLALLYRAEAQLSLREASKMAKSQRLGLLELGICPNAYQSFAKILIERGIETIPTVGIEDLKPALIEFFDKSYFGYDQAVNRRGHKIEGKLERPSGSAWLSLSRDSAQQVGKPLFGFPITLHHADEDGEYGDGESKRVVLAVHISAEDAEDVATTEDERSFYHPELDSFVVRTRFSLGGMTLERKNVPSPNHPDAKEAFAKALLSGKVEIEPRTFVEFEGEEVRALREKWRKFEEFEVTLSGSGFLSSGSGWSIKELVKKLDGRVSLGEIDNWFNFHPSRFSPKQVAIFIEKKREVMDRKCPDWKSETELFDGKAVKEELKKLRTYAADHPERIKVTDDGNIWVLGCDGSFVSPEVKYLRGRDGVHKFWPTIWSNEIVLRFAGGDYTVAAGEDAEVTEEVVEAVRSLEVRQGFPKNAFGLDESFGQEAQVLIPKIKTLCESCGAISGVFKEEVFSENASKIASSLLSANGFTLSNEAGAIIRLTKQECTKSGGWRKLLGEVDKYDALLLAFQKDGKMHLSVKLQEKVEN